MSKKLDRSMSYVEVLFAIFILLLTSLLLVQTFTSEGKISKSMTLRTEALEDLDIIIEYIHSDETAGFIYKGLDLLDLKKEVLESDRKNFSYKLEDWDLEVKKSIISGRDCIDSLVKLDFNYRYGLGRSIRLVIIVGKR